MIRPKLSRPIDVALLRAYSAGAGVIEYLVDRLDPSMWGAKPRAPRMRTWAARAGEQ
jgi:hypothetical protein